MIKTAGVVLCGGLSRRMGHPKAWLKFRNETFLTRVLRIVDEVVSPLVVVAAEGQDLPPLPASVLVARDDHPGLGPLQGLAVGLRTLVNKAEAAFVSSCDVPLLRAAFVKRMIELRGSHAICVPRIEDNFHPLASVYSLEALPAAEQLLQEKRLRLSFLFESLSIRQVSADELRQSDPDLQSVRNCNTPEDYQKILEEIGSF